MCPLNVDLLSMTFDPETAEIRSVTVIHPMKIQHFPSLPGFHTKATEPRPNKFCYMLEGLRGLLSTVKILEKFVPNKFRPSLN